MSDLVSRTFQQIRALWGDMTPRAEPARETASVPDETSANAALASANATAAHADTTVHVLDEVVRRHSRSASTVLGSPASSPAVTTRVVRIPEFKNGADTGATNQ